MAAASKKPQLLGPRKEARERHRS